ncbi:hypothetical protein RDI58_011860 [Solanum bulbocastanum]|uniref:Uncharacterized protein n=1 Tax=Solanum bulbocastanum TaxID=147425 RepID=A0AAN8TS87_SOLBU
MQNNCSAKTRDLY